MGFQSPLELPHTYTYISTCIHMYILLYDYNYIYNCILLYRKFNYSRSQFFQQRKFKMIDLTQWRVCIGMWCGRLKPFKRKSSCHNEQNCTDDCLSETNTLQLCMCILRVLLSHARVLLYTLTVCIFLQLMVSGDVEKNPGPVG